MLPSEAAMRDAAAEVAKREATSGPEAKSTQDAGEEADTHDGDDLKPASGPAEDHEDGEEEEPKASDPACEADSQNDIE